MAALRRVIGGTLGTLLAAGSAQAAAPWSPPTVIGPPANGSQAVGLGFGGSGGVIGWTLGASSYVAAVRGDGAVGRARRLPAELVAGPAMPAPGSIPGGLGPPSGHAIVFLRRLLPVRPAAPGGAPPVRRSGLGWALVAPDGAVGRMRALPASTCSTCRVVLAVNARGEAIAAWREADRVRASWRPAGGTFGHPVTVFGGRAEHPDVAAAIGPDGRAIVVDAGRRVRARIRTRRAGFGRVMTVGSGDGSVRAAASASGGGRTIVVWGSQDSGIEPNRPWVVRAARLARGHKRFSVAQVIDPGSAVFWPEGRIALAFAPGGRATVAWSAVGPRGFPVMTASAAPGARFGTAQQLAPSGAVGGLAVRADGAAVVVWSRLEGWQQPVQVFGSVRPAGATAFGAPEAIGVPEVDFFPPIVAFDPSSGRPVAAWGPRAAEPRTAAAIFNSTVHVSARAAP